MGFLSWHYSKGLEFYFETYKRYPAASSVAQLLADPNMDDYIQSVSIQDPVNRSPYLYTVTSSANSYQICYYKESTGAQVCLDNVGQ